MKEKEFKSLSVDEQKEKINELITSWYEQDSDNRCAIVILGDRKDKEDAGESLCGMLGPGNLIMASLGSSLNYNDDFKKLVVHCLLGPLGGLLCELKSKEEEKIIMEDKLTKDEQKRVEACEKVTKWASEDKEHRGCIVLAIDEKSSTCAVIGQN